MLRNPILLLVVLHVCTAPPVKPPVEKGEANNAEDPITNLEYHRYLSEIMQELENDEEFKKRVGDIQNITEQTDLFAQQLDFVNHNVRSKLDEIKRREVNRLNELEYELRRAKMAKAGETNLPPEHHLDPIDEEELKKMKSERGNHHVNHQTDTFEVEDLKKLIEKAMTDLNIIDKKEEEEFKKYEMEKEIKHRSQVKSEKDPEKRKKIEEDFEESKKRHRKHDKVHEPGSKEQMKEVWEDEDHLEKDSFNPNTFFSLHDTNDDGNLDQNEIESLFQSELDKVYNSSDSDDDMYERYHEMHRMRKYLVKKMDINKDNLISKEEFTQYMQSRESETDNDWKTEEELDDKPFSDEEYQKYENEYRQKHPDMFPSEDDNGNLVYKPRDSERKPSDHETQEKHENKPADHPAANAKPEQHPPSANANAQHHAPPSNPDNNPRV